MCGGEAKVRTTNRPPDNAFQQQKLKAWQPLLTPTWVIGTFLAVAILFLPLGIIIVSASNDIFEVEVEYGQSSDDQILDMNYTFTKDVPGPVYFYYKLTNFYQNHRRYVKSRSDTQLNGAIGGSVSSCAPLDTDDATGETLYPCGLIANSFMNDTFTAKVKSVGGTSTPLNYPIWDTSSIAWPSDKDKFTFRPLQSDEIRNQRVPVNENDEANVEDPHFMVWMRTAGLPTFKKLYAKMDRDFKKDDVLTITVTDNFPTQPFEGKKYWVISTTSWLGGKNGFLGFTYIIVGAICFILAGAFFAKHKMSPRALGDMKYFNWPALRPHKPAA